MDADTINRSLLAAARMVTLVRGWEVDEILWCIEWSVAITPELAMIPDRSVFLRSSQERSLTATIEGMPSDIWEVREHAHAGDNVGNLSDVEVVEGIYCCTIHKPRLEIKVSQDRALFV